MECLHIFFKEVCHNQINIVIGGGNNLSNVDYIYMPFDEEELLVRIKALLRSNN